MGFKLQQVLCHIRIFLRSKLGELLSGFILRKDGTINRKVMGLLLRETPVNKTPVDGVSSEDFSFDKHPETYVRVFVPSCTDSQTKLPLIIFYHGGGFGVLSPAVIEFDGLCRRLAKNCEAIVVSAGYRLAPEHKFPIAYEDCFAALKWVGSQASNVTPGFPSNVDYSRVFLCGDSAGGNIVHHVGVMAATFDMAPITMAGLVELMPFFRKTELSASEIRLPRGKFNSQVDSDFYMRAYLPRDADFNHPASNPFSPESPDYSTIPIPKILVVIGGQDPLHDNGRDYAEAMQAAGKDCKLLRFPNACHGFYVYKEHEDHDDMMKAIVSFVKS